MVKIRMKMVGRTHHRCFRICAIDSRQQRDGKSIEELGTYDPYAPDGESNCVIDRERVAYWLSVGAQPSDKVRVLLKKAGVALPVKRKRKRKKSPA